MNVVVLLYGLCWMFGLQSLHTGTTRLFIYIKPIFNLYKLRSLLFSGVNSGKCFQKMILSKKYNRIKILHEVATI